MRTRLLIALVLLVPVFAAPALAQTAPRAWIAVNGGYQASTNDFSDGATFTEHAEQGDFDTEYSVEAGPTFDVAGGVRIVGRLAVGVGVTRFTRSTAGAFTASVPHPFFFNTPREVTGDIGSLTREELAVHVQARGVFPLNDRFQIMLFGGPSFFTVKQDMVTDFEFSEAYPYDTATFSRGVTTQAKESKVGVNAGADIGYFFTRQLGVGFGVQYSGATIELPSAASGSTADVKVGGLQAGGGLRLRF